MFKLNGKLIIFRCPKIWAHYSLTIMCLNIGTPNNHHFLFGTNVKAVVLGVQILKHFRVLLCCRSYGRDSLSRYAHSATRTFQALRIFVNNEMNELHNGLELVNMYLKPGGVCIAIAFHSLEDRIIKRHFHNIDLDLPNNISIHKRAKPRGAYSVYTEQKLADTAKPKWLPLKKKVDLPSVEEVSENPRSRSAKLRAALKT